MPRPNTDKPPPAGQLLKLEVRFATTRRGVPHVRKLREWAQAAYLAYALEHLGTRRKALRVIPAQVALKIVGAAESRKLNREWRGKDYSTNVLSFPAGAEFMPEDEHCLGDLAICAPVVAREAQQQGKPVAAHWAHMVVHGVLHLLGYDHENERDALRMESCEAEILAQCGFDDPYAAEHAA